MKTKRSFTNIRLSTPLMTDEEYEREFYGEEPTPKPEQQQEPRTIVAGTNTKEAE